MITCFIKQISIEFELHHILCLLNGNAFKSGIDHLLDMKNECCMSVFLCLSAEYSVRFLPDHLLFPNPADELVDLLGLFGSSVWFQESAVFRGVCRECNVRCSSVRCCCSVSVRVIHSPEHLCIHQLSQKHIFIHLDSLCCVSLICLWFTRLTLMLTGYEVISGSFPLSFTVTV